MDAVQKADSGHPGTPMALAPLAYVLWTRHLRYNPADPDWLDRDRFVLSAGHASMLLYSVLYLTGYDLTLDDLKQFRQWESKTPGHPELGYTPGVETTTGPLGQGVGNAVGMAVAEAHLGAVFNRDQKIVDHNTYFIASDGDMMEGVSHEAASFAGHSKLGKLIGFYDDNHITIDGDTDLTFSDDTGARFEAYGWHVLHVADVNDLERSQPRHRCGKGRDIEAVSDRCPLAHRVRQPEQGRHRGGARLRSGPRRDRSHQEDVGLSVAGAVLRAPEALRYWRDAGKQRAKLRGRMEDRPIEAYKTANPGPREGIAAPSAR